jgi:histidine triad (HIT) family protein
MRNKTISLFIILILIGFGRDSLFSQEDCAFCDPAVLERQTFYEDDLVLALYTHRPIFPGHCLIIPKRHVERFEMLTDSEITQIGRVIRKVNRAVQEVFHTVSYLLLQKNGPEVGQTVPHVHVHYIPREEGDDSSLKFVLKMYLANVGKPIDPSEMRAIVEKMRVAMNSQY